MPVFFNNHPKMEFLILSLVLLCFTQPMVAVIKCEDREEPFMRHAETCYVVEDLQTECNQLTEKHEFFNGSCFVFVDTPKSRHEAAEGCTQIRSDGHLLYLTSGFSSLNDQEIASIINTNLSKYGFVDAWIGLEFNEEQNKWKWGDGTVEDGPTELWASDIRPERPYLPETSTCARYEEYSRIFYDDCAMRLNSICQYDESTTHCQSGTQIETPPEQLIDIIPQLFSSSIVTGDVRIYLRDDMKMDVGDSFIIEGYVTEDPPPQFEINFNINPANIVLRVNPIWDAVHEKRLIDMVAFDTMVGGYWQVYVRRPGPNPIIAGQKFKIIITAATDGFEISFPNAPPSYDNFSPHYAYKYEVYHPEDIEYIDILATSPNVHIYSVRHNNKFLGPPGLCVRISDKQTKGICDCVDVNTREVHKILCSQTAPRICSYEDSTLQS